MALTTRKLEKAALGNALRWGTAVNPSQFNVAPHSEICRAILAVRAAGLPVGLNTVAEWLRQQGVLEQVGSTRYLAELMLSADARSSG